MMIFVLFRAWILLHFSCLHSVVFSCMNCVVLSYMHESGGGHHRLHEAVRHHQAHGANGQERQHDRGASAAYDC